MNRNTVSPGSGNAKASTNSVGEPAASIWSINSLPRRWMYGMRVLMRRFEKPCRVYLRILPWSGSGRFDKTATGL